MHVPDGFLDATTSIATGAFAAGAVGLSLQKADREIREAGPGTVIWAPADVPHGVREALERTVMLVGIAPPPR